jgi:DNA-binding LytR/AlgR family response regulator
MKVVVIEDERLTAEDLVHTITQVDPSFEIVAKLRSVNEGLDYFKTNLPPDLIFSDIQLGDGQAFEILKDLHVPVIFCTAYDEYALNAFKANGIDYILKPFTTNSVSVALQKFKNLTQVKHEQVADLQYESIKRMLLDSKPVKNSSLLIHYKDTIFPVKIEKIALFRLENDIVKLMTFDKAIYYPGKRLEELEEIVGNNFFRVNRQYLINRKAIINASSLFSRKLSLTISIPVKENITISKEKSSIFLKWLTEETL